MGGERWLLMKSAKEAQRAMEFLGDGIETESIGLWFELGNSRRLDVGYSFGGMDSAASAFVAREIARRFDVRKVGADSVGYYKNSDWKRERKEWEPDYGDLSTWVEWLENYNAHWAFEVYSIDRWIQRYEEAEVKQHYRELKADTLKQLHEIEQEVMAWFRERDPEHILCAAIYVDTGKAEPPRRSYAYPETGLVFAAWRHGDCFTTMQAWADRLTDEEKAEIEAVQEGQLRGRNQGFLTSKGRYVDREEGWEIALEAGQVESKKGEGAILFSEDLY